MMIVKLLNCGAICLAGLSSMAFAQDTIPGFDPTDEVALVRSVFATLQLRSIAENVEYCGYIGYDADGTLVATPAVRGEEASCLPADPVELDVVVASYHTHGGFSPDYTNEVPSIDDYEGDEAEGIDGYVATPGGRLWYIDTMDEEISQICGLGCLPSDPTFQRGSDGVISQSYTYDELVTKLEDDS